MFGRERDHDVGVLSPNRRRVAIRKIDTAIGQPDVIDHAGKLWGRYLLADFVFYAVAQGGGLLNACSGWGTHVQGEFAAIDRWEKVLSQPGEQSKRKQAAQQKSRHEYAPTVDECLKQPTIGVPNTLETALEPGLKARQWIPAHLDFISMPFGVGLEKVFGHGGHQCPRKQIRSQHGEYNRFGQ